MQTASSSCLKSCCVSLRSSWRSFTGILSFVFSTKLLALVVIRISPVWTLDYRSGTIPCRMDLVRNLVKLECMQAWSRTLYSYASILRRTCRECQRLESHILHRRFCTDMCVSPRSIRRMFNPINWSHPRAVCTALSWFACQVSNNLSLECDTYPVGAAMTFIMKLSQREMHSNPKQSLNRTCSFPCKLPHVVLSATNSATTTSRVLSRKWVRRYNWESQQPHQVVVG